MRWWEKRKHLLVREKSRIDEKFSNNDFSFEVRDDELWITGTILDFFKFELRYPPCYPSGLPNIFPKNRSSKWVPRHQYVNGGRFCLNIREKTWCSRLTAAEIIMSLSVLLLAEGIRLTKGDKDLLVYEEPEPTIFERAARYIKCVLPSDLEFPQNESYGRFNYIYKFTSNTCRFVITDILDGEDEVESPAVKKVWLTDIIHRKYKGLWVKLEKNKLRAVLLLDEPEKLFEYLKNQEIIPTELSLPEYLGEDSDFKILALESDQHTPAFFIECNIKKNTVTKWGTYLVDLKNLADRIPNKENYEHLKGKKVTIIGCGSGGSKDAEYLAKSGVGTIVLIDDDILKTENILRHSCLLPDLSIGKVYAVEDKLKKINPDIEIQTLRKNLDIIDTHTDKLMHDSDLIIVATASDEELFNEYAFSHGIPAIYSKVYPMGFGGEIIRVIPGVTPCFECSHYFKEAIIKEAKPDAKFPEIETVSYDTLADGTQISVPALAVDSDFISLINVKMALELLIEKDIENLKNSPHIRLWGNKEEWIFNQAYESITIENDNVKSIKNCIICHGDAVIENELDKTPDQISADHEEIISHIKSTVHEEKNGNN